MNSDTQIIWGVISAVENEQEINDFEILKISSEDIVVCDNDKFLIPES